MNRKQQPLFMIQETESGRPSRLVLIIAMLILLGVVLVVSFKLVTPGGASFGFSNRHARHQLAEAERLERDSLYRYAAEIYSGVVDNTKINDDYRRKAAMRLAVIYTENLPEADKAEVALEKAYVLYPAGPERDAVRRRLETLRGRPVEETEPSSFASDGQPPVQKDARVIARIGSRPVTLDEILFAWQEYQGSAQPEGPAFREFVNHYLNLVLLARKAEELKLDAQGRTAMDLNLKRLTVLNSALTQYMIEKLPAPDADTLGKFYKANADMFAQPASAVIGHILAGDEATARKVMDAFKTGGESFEAIAKRYSKDAGQLEDGCRLGEIFANQRTLPGLGELPGLAARLVMMKDGATTGPIATDRGVHWIKVYETHLPKPMPFDAIRDQVLFAYQKAQLMLQRDQLIVALKKQYPIEIIKTGQAQSPAAPAGETPTPQAEVTATSGTRITSGTHTTDAATTAAARENEQTDASQ